MQVGDIVTFGGDHQETLENFTYVFELTNSPSSDAFTDTQSGNEKTTKLVGDSHLAIFKKQQEDLAEQQQAIPGYAGLSMVQQQAYQQAYAAQQQAYVQQAYAQQAYQQAYAQQAYQQAFSPKQVSNHSPLPFPARGDASPAPATNLSKVSEFLSPSFQQSSEQPSMVASPTVNSQPTKEQIHNELSKPVSIEQMDRSNDPINRSHNTIMILEENLKQIAGSGRNSSNDVPSPSRRLAKSTSGAEIASALSKTPLSSINQSSAEDWQERLAKKKPKNAKLRLTKDGLTLPEESSKSTKNNNLSTIFKLGYLVIYLFFSFLSLSLSLSFIAFSLSPFPLSPLLLFPSPSLSFIAFSHSPSSYSLLFLHLSILLLEFHRNKHLPSSLDSIHHLFLFLLPLCASPFFFFHSKSHHKIS